MGSYDGIITQWSYTADRSIVFQGTYVSDQSSAPSWLSFGVDYKTVYATNEYLGRVQAFAVDEKTGGLELVNEVPSFGGSPCHIGVAPSGRFIIVANYFGGNMTVLPINETTGGLLPASQVVSSFPSSNSHLHAAYVHSGYVTMVDKGLGLISQFALGEDGLESLTPAVVVNATAFHGPTHIKFDRTGSFAVVVNALSVSLTIIPLFQGTLQVRRHFDIYMPLLVSSTETFSYCNR
jgi:6-phosphogluconolactonase